MRTSTKPLLLTALIGANIGLISTAPISAEESCWQGPSCLAASPDHRSLLVGCAKSRTVLRVDLSSEKAVKIARLPAAPGGLAISPDGKTLVITCAEPEGRVLLANPADGRIQATLRAGHTPMAPVISADNKTLFVCNRFDHDVSVFDLPAGKEAARIPVRREPVAAALTCDGRRLLVANHLHTGRSDASHVAAVVSVIDTIQRKVIDDLRLPNGSGLLNDIAISPDGKYAIVSHLLARYNLPTTQLERGWMMTNAKTLIDLERMEVINTVLLDSIDRGAANPWGVCWSPDSSKVLVTLAGTHEVSIARFPELVAKLRTLAPTQSPGALPVGPASRVGPDVPNDLTFIHELRQRLSLPEGNLGPRAVAVSGNTAWIANYFSDTLCGIDLTDPEARIATLNLGPSPSLHGPELGEMYFNDARLCFQGWQSCASCHPGNGRADGLNWDLLNDGIGNPKNNKSLLLAFQTPPAMSVGVREDAAAAVRAGVRHILFTEQPGMVTEALDAYLKGLQPVPSPYLVNKRLSKAAARGKRLFESKKVGCAECHPAPLFTDLKPYDVGTRNVTDREVSEFDTPTLIELWRTAPYLHDGSAMLREVLLEANKGDRHGRTSHLTAQEISDLEQYLLSL